MTPHSAIQPRPLRDYVIHAGQGTITSFESVQGQKKIGHAVSQSETGDTKEEVFECLVPELAPRTLEIVQ